MPSTSVLEAKQKVVAELKEKVTSSVAGVLVDYKGISAENDTKLRKELREAGVDYFVVKNTLLKLAIADTDFEGLSSVLEGTTAMAVSQDPISAAKILNEYAKKSEGAFTIKSGYMDSKVLTTAEISELAELPSKEGLLQMLLSVLTSGTRGLAVALNAIAEKETEGDVA
ncbi:MAG: 50S ribosomal protein L10 [Clostridia bacterium]